MAKTKVKALENPRPKTSPYLCCFGISSSSSLPHKTPTKESNIIGSDHEQHKKLEQKKHRRWFSSWENIIRIGVKSQSTKTVPIEGSELSQEKDQKEKVKLKSKPKGIKAVNEVHHHSSKLRSKSNLHNKTSQQPNTIPPPPRQKPPPLIPDTPNQTPSHSQTPRQNSENNNLENDTCQKSSSPPTRPAAAAMSHAVSLPTSKRQVRRLLSSLQVQPQTTLKRQRKQHQNAKRSYNGVVGASVVMVTLVIMILWGRFCAIVCTSVWLYFVPRFRLMGDENDVVENAISNDSNDLDLDSVVYKKKVVLEGLLQRNHSSVL